MSTLAIHATTERIAATPRPKSRPKRKAMTISKAQMSMLEKYLTLSLGCSIPGFSLVLSCVSGHMLSVVSESWVPKIMGLFALGLCISILGVSLNHLASAIAVITKSPRWSAWAMALSIDLTLVMAEMAGVARLTDEVDHLRIGLMAAVTLWSAVLNCHAFMANETKQAK